MNLLTRLDRHIGRTVFLSTLLVFAILLALFAFFSLIDALKDFGKGHFGLYEIVKYVTLSLPGWLYALFPVAALLGAIFGLAWLAVGSELTAMRAAGISLARIVGAVMKIGLVFVLLGILIGETVVPVSETWAQRGRAEALEIGLHRERTGLWLRDGDDFVNIGEVLPDQSLLRVNIYRFDQASQLRRHTSAARAHFVSAEAGVSEPAWRLEAVRYSWIDNDSVRTRELGNDLWRSGVTPDVVEVFAVRPEALSTWHLFRYIQHLRRNRQETGRYELAFWNKALLPVATAVMVLLAVPFVFQQVRGGGMGRRIMLGIMLGFAFIVLNQAFGHLALLSGLPPFLAATLPIILFLLLALQLFRRVA
ncbi:MAG: LPS export ABC transporter permease LptG [Acidiferrobacterales bacterium]